MENDYLKYLSEEDREAIIKIRKEREEKEAKRHKELKSEMGLFGEVRKAYRVTKKEEKANRFLVRHDRLSEASYDYYGVDRPHVHIFGESLYQLDKFKIRKDDTATRYVVRNRGLALVLASAIVVTGAYAIYKHNQEISMDPTAIEQSDNSICLTRYYTVTRNDTLSEISANTGISVDRIQRENNIDNANMINMNHRLVLNYYISPENIEYYTQEANVEGLTIYQVADEYHTDVDTLVKLNSEAIEVGEDGTYHILSNTLAVPNFITPSELASLKSDQK